MSEPVKKIVVISDGTGKTAKRLTDAVLAQYASSGVEYALENTYQQVRSERDFDKILQEIDEEYLVVFSIISKDLSKYICARLSERDILHLNVLRPMLSTMSKFLGFHPDYRPGILQRIDDRYYKKVDAIGYTVEHDDGRGQFVGEADAVLLGLSRTCKTPISMYLACNHGMKVANIPIYKESNVEQYLTRRLVPLKQSAIIGLVMQPEVLAHVREERAYHIAGGAPPRTELLRYTDIREIRSEHRFCMDLYRRNGWKTIDVTRRAIEEVSLEILELLGHVY